MRRDRGEREFVRFSEKYLIQSFQFLQQRAKQGFLAMIAIRKVQKDVGVIQQSIFSSGVATNKLMKTTSWIFQQNKNMHAVPGIVGERGEVSLPGPGSSECPSSPIV